MEKQLINEVENITNALQEEVHQLDQQLMVFRNKEPSALWDANILIRQVQNETLEKAITIAKTVSDMSYLAVNKDGKEVRFDGKHSPFRWEGRWYQPSDNSECVEGRNITLCNVGKTQPFGTIIALTGQKLTWEDEPIKI